MMSCEGHSTVRHSKVCQKKEAAVEAMIKSTIAPTSNKHELTNIGNNSRPYRVALRTLQATVRRRKILPASTCHLCDFREFRAGDRSAS
mmetsp:Transcript_3518/g.13616  ORF Transcript_3518/g.13616 Transcript_3518/m.13616 type:complete len:89 (+) Transcript_3518:2377-2643(+)